MEKKDIVKYFYETVVSENLLDEVSTLRIGRLCGKIR